MTCWDVLVGRDLHHQGGAQLGELRALVLHDGGYELILEAQERHREVDHRDLQPRRSRDTYHILYILYSNNIMFTVTINLYDVIHIYMKYNILYTSILSTYIMQYNIRYIRVDGMSLAGSVPSQRGFGYVDPHRDVPGISASESRRPTTYPEVPGRQAH